MGADQRRLQLRLLVLHRPLDARARGQPAVGRARRRRSQALAADGVREVTLLGQNVNSYGRDLPSASARSFAELLRAVDAIDGIERIRYTSPHPKDMREDVIRAHAELPALCEHIHLPLQSGSSAVLKRMRRTYTRERYLDRVALIREHVPDCALTTDIIVGFPGETEADFEQTLEVAEEVGYDGAFTFIFSPRRGTEAAALHRSGSARRQGCSGWSASSRSSSVGRTSAPSGSSGATLEVLVEGPSDRSHPSARPHRATTRSSTSTGLGAPGELVEVEIQGRPARRCSGQETILSRAAG